MKTILSLLSILFASSIALAQKPVDTAGARRSVEVRDLGLRYYVGETGQTGMYLVLGGLVKTKDGACAQPYGNDRPRVGGKCYFEIYITDKLTGSAVSGLIYKGSPVVLPAHAIVHVKYVADAEGDVMLCSPDEYPVLVVLYPLSKGKTQSRNWHEAGDIRLLKIIR